MRAYILGAGASANAGYPLASKLLVGLSAWLDLCDISAPWVPRARNRILQIRETFVSLSDFEGILGKLESYGQQRVKPPGPTTYRQDPIDILHDFSGQLEGVPGGTGPPVEGFYPQYLRSDLISAFREWFYAIEKARSDLHAYDSFAERKAAPDSTIITFNYDIALERALAKASKWDIGNGYGFPFLADRPTSKLKVYKLHGSVNWFKHPLVNTPSPVIFERDLRLLGYQDLVDSRVANSGMTVDNSASFILPDPKKNFYWESFWCHLWSAAAKRLRSVDEVLVHGYSMPTVDARARQLLFDNIKRSAAIRIYCRSLSERIEEEFKARGFTDVRSFPSIDFETWTVSQELPGR